MGGSIYKAKRGKTPSVGLHYSAQVVGKLPPGGLAALKPGELPVEVRRGRKKGSQRKRRKRQGEHQ